MKQFLILISIFLFTNQIHSQMMASNSIYEIKINSINGSEINLNDFKGKKILFVNVASECGFTSQYEGLQKLYDLHKDKLMIIGVPSNQFGKQEPGTAAQIASFCKLNYGVTFLITEKVAVKGAEQHPLYAWLTDKKINGNKSSNVKWNFQKYLVDENGELIDYYWSLTKPMSKKITKHLE